MKIAERDYLESGLIEILRTFKFLLQENYHIKGKNYTLKSQAEFVQQNLMPVIIGETWIDRLINKLN